MEGYVKYKSFYDLKEAEIYKDYISKLGFEVNLHSMQKNLTELTGESIQPEITIWILLEDLAKLNATVEAEIKNDHKFLQTHYLREFSPEELKDILLNEEEWSFEDVIVAKILLHESGFDTNSLEKIKSDNQQKLQQGKDVSNFELVVVTAALVAAIFLVNSIFSIGLIGQGLYYKYDKVTDHQGNKHFSFNEEVRTKGTVILIVGVVWAAVILVGLGYTIYLGF